MAEKKLIVDKIESTNFKAVTYLSADPKTEGLYVVYNRDNKPYNPIILELATSAEDITKIRDFLIDIVNKIEDNYGLEHEVIRIKK